MRFCHSYFEDLFLVKKGELNVPYILREERPKYCAIIMSTTEECYQDRHVSTALYYGHFVYGLVRRMLGGGTGWLSLESTPFLTQKPFQEAPPPDMAKIEENLLSLQALLSKDTDVLMGEMNYVLSAVGWGLLGDDEHSAPYCLRVYIKGVLWTVMEELCKSSSPYVNMLIRGLLSDVIDDLPSALYEDTKS